MSGLGGNRPGLGSGQAGLLSGVRSLARGNASLDRLTLSEVRVFEQRGSVRPDGRPGLTTCLPSMGPHLASDGQDSNGVRPWFGWVGPNVASVPQDLGRVLPNSGWIWSNSARFDQFGLGSAKIGLEARIDPVWAGVDQSWACFDEICTDFDKLGLASTNSDSLRPNLLRCVPVLFQSSKSPTGVAAAVQKSPVPVQ